MVDHRSGPDTDEFPAVPDPVVTEEAVHPVERVGNQKRATGFALVVLMVLVVVILGALAFLFLGSGSDATDTASVETSPAQTTTPTAVEAPEEASAETTVYTVTETPAPIGRPTDPVLPGGHSPVNDAARSNTPAGDLNNVYTGTQATSPEFARAVRDAFISNYLDTGELNGQVRATSPVTGQTYEINCEDNGEFVTCTGGTNAVIYIS